MHKIHVVAFCAQHKSRANSSFRLPALFVRYLFATHYPLQRSYSKGAIAAHAHDYSSSTSLHSPLHPHGQGFKTSLEPFDFLLSITTIKTANA